MIRFILSYIALATLCIADVPPRATLDVNWNYDTPPGFSLLEPSYRFPIQIKQALVEQVQINSNLAKEYDSVFRDKLVFADWFRKILEKRQDALIRVLEAGKKILESKAAKDYPNMPIIRGTATRNTNYANEINSIQRYLVVLKEWCPEVFVDEK